MSGILYLKCRKCFELGESSPVDVLVMDEDLYIMCRNETHGPILIQPLDRRQLLPEHCEVCKE